MFNRDKTIRKKHLGQFMKNSKIDTRGLINILHLENNQWNLIRTVT